jgi:segregation and condensation protein A
VLPLEHARDSLKSLSKLIDSWASLDELRARMGDIASDIPPRSVMASVFSAALELARDGDIELRQGAHFSPLYLRGSQDNKEGISA